MPLSSAVPTVPTEIITIKIIFFYDSSYRYAKKKKKMCTNIIGITEVSAIVL